MSGHKVILLTTEKSEYKRIIGVVIDGHEFQIEAGSHISMTGGPQPSMVTMTFISQSVEFQDRDDYLRSNYLYNEEDS